MHRILILLLVILPLKLFATDIEIIADVNGEPISNLDVEKRIKLITSLFGNQNINPREVRSQILQQLVDEIIITNESHRLNIKLSDEEINNSVVSFFTQNFELKAEEVSQYTKKHDIDLKGLTKQIKYQLLWNKIIEARIVPFIHGVSDEEVDNARRQEVLNSTLSLKQIIVKDSDGALENLKKQKANCSNFNKLTNDLKLPSIKEFKIKMRDLNPELQVLFNKTNINEIVEIKEGSTARLIMLCNIESDKIDIEAIKQGIYQQKIMKQSSMLFDEIRKNAIVNYHKNFK
ncbi:SurA N-terminal domain-containing protein [Wolbachia endosymbiont of Pentalonia nigronervosa]|uniref:SurA N-terminal domain-containing protein n=1 Tax=Wolbachia endosymbiont of Pentalonia nigronervosa TaxID=1301914 RepID=UPI00165F4449|nr:SurA N-terminal domain-containing protein [Wolbachia endosymbiont of Pentalonia nigronervosa]MBD0391346.1 SurA N-terminal domain-containing protein [Wolbachia endosymbiont of Pentalonia nigronervosa]